MAIVVNTNVSSINAQRRLNSINRSLDTSLQRLASGLRINTAADDAAGLAIADGIQSQVRGLTQAVRNAGDGLSVVGTAEGTLSTQTEILQRIRELAVQASNDINSSGNRAAIQDEIEAQIDELTRLGDTTEFNGQLLMNGTFTNKHLQVGAFAGAGQSLEMNLGDFRASGMGSIAEVEGTANVDNTAIAGGGDLTISSPDTSAPVNIGPSADDGLSTYLADTSAIAKANAINAASGSTGVEATAQDSTTQSNSRTMGGVVSTTQSMTINEVVIFDNETFSLLEDDEDGTLRNKINAKSNETGVVASLSGSGAGTRILLTAEDGRNIRVEMDNPATNTGFTNASYTGTGTVNLYSDQDFTVSGTGDASTLIGIDEEAYSVDTNKRVNKIDVTTRDGAQEAIRIIDSALGQVADQQAALGALTNRLENTISNIEVSIENLSASESRIRDADFAAETANLTRAQIIQQSSIATLTQANLRPQAALSLLG
ncbi:MAG: flagellin [Candidatus Sumerlaeia bacterium]